MQAGGAPAYLQPAGQRSFGALAAALYAVPHDLPDQIIARFGSAGSAIYQELRTLFDLMYHGVLLENSYLILHGGVPVTFSSVSDIAKANKTHPRIRYLEEILWNDPREELEGFVPNIRGEGTYFYGNDVTLDFLKNNSLKGIIRGHEVADGFRLEMNERIITVFSSRYHKMRAGILIQENGEFKQVFLDEKFLFDGERS
ncbi:MAG: metallophosphoesterase [Thermoplasmatales archaeon]